MTITATAPLAGEQGSLLDTGWRDPAAAEAALERLRAELGPNVVVRPVARDAHRPERRGEWRDFSEVADAGLTARGAPPGSMMASPPAGSITSPSPVGPESRASDAEYAALRLLEAPEVVAVECRGDGGKETPAAMEWRGRRVAFARAEGPERLSGEWWKEGFRRDYWRCESEGSEFLIFLERPVAPATASSTGATPRWCVQGWYD